MMIFYNAHSNLKLIFKTNILVKVHELLVIYRSDFKTRKKNFSEKAYFSLSAALKRGRTVIQKYVKRRKSPFGDLPFGDWRSALKKDQ